MKPVHDDSHVNEIAGDEEGTLSWMEETHRQTCRWPEPYALHPAPCTLNNAPYTLNTHPQMSMKL